MLPVVLACATSLLAAAAPVELAAESSAAPGPRGWELLVLGAILLLGFVAHVAGRRLHVPRVTLLLIEVLGFVLVCGGAASVLGVSYLVACMSLGAVVANQAKHHTRPFHAIEGVMEPFLVVFFLLAGSRSSCRGFGASG